MATTSNSANLKATKLEATFKSSSSEQIFSSFSSANSPYGYISISQMRKGNKRKLQMKKIIKLLALFLTDITQIALE